MQDQIIKNGIIFVFLRDPACPVPQDLFAPLKPLKAYISSLSLCFFTLFFASFKIPTIPDIG